MTLTGTSDEAPITLRAFSQSLPMALLRARESVMQHFRPALRKFGLTEQQWRILRALSAVDEIEVTELAKRAFLLAPSLTRILRDLEQRKLVKRRSDRTDLRRSKVSLSAKGERLIATVAPTSEQIYEQMAAHFGSQRLSELQSLLQELEACFTNMPNLHQGVDD